MINLPTKDRKEEFEWIRLLKIIYYHRYGNTNHTMIVIKPTETTMLLTRIVKLLFWVCMIKTQICHCTKVNHVVEPITQPPRLEYLSKCKLSWTFAIIFNRSQRSLICNIFNLSFSVLNKQFHFHTFKTALWILPRQNRLKM